MYTSRTSIQLNLSPNTYPMITYLTTDLYRLVRLNLLPLTMLLEFNDICFFIKSLKHISPSNSFNISKFVSFSQHHTRSGSFSKLVQPLIKHNRDINSSTLTGYPNYGILFHQAIRSRYLLECVCGKFRP